MKHLNMIKKLYSIVVILLTITLLFPTTINAQTASKVCDIKNFLGVIVASYTLKGTFRYDGTSATCTNATYSTSTDSAFWSFESATAYASGAKAIGNFTVKSLTDTISKNITITCSNTEVIS